jgi:hypothetical protein
MTEKLMTLSREGIATCAVLLSVALSDATAQPPPDLLRTENVVLITIDGLRWQEVFGGADAALLDEEHGAVDDVEALQEAFWRETAEGRRAALMPFFWSVVAREGRLFGNRDDGNTVRGTNGKYFSYPGYNELLSGFPDDRIDSNAKRPNPNVTVLEWLNALPRFRDRVAVFGSWDVFPYIVNRERSGIPVNAGWEELALDTMSASQHMLNQLMHTTYREWENVRFDGFTFSAALEYLKQRQPRVLYLALDEPDDWAHAGTYDHYLESTRRIDDMLRTLWETLESLPAYRDRTAIVITSDHGRGSTVNDWTDHGADVRGAEFLWIAVMGPDTPAGGVGENGEEFTLAQVAATVAALLGEDYAGDVPQAAASLPVW